MGRKTSKHRSLPVISEGRLFAAIKLLCKRQKDLPKIALKGLDTKGSDIKRFLNILGILEEKKDSLSINEIGIKYFCSTNEEAEIKKNLKEIFSIRLDEFEVLIDSLLTLKQLKIEKEKLFLLIQERLWKRGRKFDIPGYNSLLSIGRITGVIQNIKSGVLTIAQEYLTYNYLEIKILNTINEIRKTEDIREFLQTKTLISIITKNIPEEISIPSNLIYQKLIDRKEIFGVGFKMGIGHDFIESDKAVVKIR